MPDQSAASHSQSPTERTSFESSDPWKWRHLLPVMLAVLVVLAFMPALLAGFVDWDDNLLLVENTRYQELTGENLRWMFTTSYSGHFQPLTWLSYSLDYALWDGNPVGFHLTNALLHALAAVAFYYVVRLLLGVALAGPEHSTTSRSGMPLRSPLDKGGIGGVERYTKAGPAPRAIDNAIRSRPIALSAAFAAALFAIHPLRAESVAWLAERRDVLSGFLYVAAVLCYLRYAIRSTTNDRPRSFYVGSILLCVLSLTAKASAMTIPFVLLILDVYPLRRLGGARGFRAGPARRVWIEKLPFLLLAVASGIRALIAQQEGGNVYSLVEHDLFARLAQACFGLVFYIWKTLLPIGLGPLYQLPPRDLLTGFMFWGSLIVLIAVVYGALRFRRSCPGIAAALAVYAVVLSPVLGLVQTGPQLVADRYSYLSCLGFAVLAGVLLLRGFHAGSWWAMSGRRPLLALLASGVVTILFFLTFFQTEIWDSPIRLWQRGVRVSPDSSVAHVNLADALAKSGMLDRAVGHYQRGLELDPEDAIAHDHLARVLRARGFADLAIDGFTEAIRLDPHRPGAHRALAELLLKSGRAVEAVRVLREGIGVDPRNLGMIDFLAQILAAHPDEQVRDGDDAVNLAQYVNAARGNQHASALTTLATAYAEVGRFDDAVETAIRALDLAGRDGNERLTRELEHRITLFQSDKPYRLEFVER